MTTRSTKGRIGAEDARAFKERWRLVNEADREELQFLTPAEKFRQIEVVMELAQALGWIEKMESQPDRANENWRRLREAYRV